MSRNVLYLVIAGLAVVTAVIGYQLYQERQKTSGIEISVGERGISIKGKQLFNSDLNGEDWIGQSKIV